MFVFSWGLWSRANSRNHSILGVSILRAVIVAGGWGDMDLTYKFATNYIWRYGCPSPKLGMSNPQDSMIEINVGIVCACAPCLRALVGRYVPSLLQLGGRNNTVDLYTIPVSQVARCLPGTPAREDPKDTASHETTRIALNWRGKMFGSNSSSSTGEQKV